MVIKYTDLAQKKDLTQKNFREGWTLTNENISVYIPWIIQIQPKRVLAILSGGEIPLLDFLPYGCQVTGVDISYNSIRASMVKIALLKRYGAELKATLPQDEKRFIEFVDANLTDDLPPELSKDAGYRMTLGTEWSYAYFKHLWMNTPNDILEKARQNIGNLGIVHGNLEAITDEDYDTLYVSNIFDGLYGVSKKTLERQNLKHIMASGSSVNHKNLELLERIDDILYQGKLIPWSYYLYSVSIKDKIN